MSDAARAGLSRVVFAVALAALVVGVRWIMLSRLGTDVPYRDQWDSEIAALYKPFVEGDFGIAALFAAHNEHRIVFSRLFNLALFEANGGQFDNLVESFANVLLYALAFFGFAWPVLRRLSGPSLLLGGVAALCAAGLPFGWENLVFGFQNAFFFMNGYAVLALALGAFAHRRVAIAAAVFVCVLSLFTLASGLLASVALAFVLILRAHCGDLAPRRAWPAAAASVAVGVAGLVLLTPVAGHAALQPQTLPDLFAAVIGTASWPLPPMLLGAALVWWPSALTLARALRAHRVASIDVYLLGVCAWALLQACAVAWSRGHEMAIASSRYTDTLALGALANVTLAIRLLPLSDATRRGRLLAAAVALTALGCFGGMVAFGIRGLTMLSHHAADSERSRENLRAYVDGDPHVFDGKPDAVISYPHAERLRLLLDDETIRRMLPMSVRRPLRAAPDRCVGFEFPGTPASLRPEPDALGSYTAAFDESVGECTGRLAHTSWPYLLWRIAGNPQDPGMSFTVADGAGRTIAAAAANSDGRWMPLTVAAADAARWTARDANLASWIAFSPPVEVGRLTMLTQRLAAALRLDVLFDARPRGSADAPPVPARSHPE